jgi:hypothetical protein
MDSGVKGRVGFIGVFSFAFARSADRVDAQATNRVFKERSMVDVYSGTYG